MGVLFRMRGWTLFNLRLLVLCLLLLLLLLPLGVLTRPQGQPQREQAAVGAWLVDDEGKQILVKPSIESEPIKTTGGGSGEKAEKDQDFFTESYSIDDLFSSPSSS